MAASLKKNASGTLGAVHFRTVADGIATDEEGGCYLRTVWRACEIASI